MTEGAPSLKRTLSGLHLWGIAVGLVISGEYFGWSYGWAQAGTLGFLVTTVFIAVMYTTFHFQLHGAHYRHPSRGRSVRL